MATSTIQVKIDKETRKAAEMLFDSLGLDLMTAIKLFLKQAVNQQRIPFEIVTPPPSALISQMNSLAAAGK
ncbi:MAG: type II toxin-antitoxin system RelB/DinJ family antitoxin, partial [Spirochaetaceae bacterium]|nr:type II toxin-antitoxin system RelB/DinJ family antitoxin [Spirochaetaceae bacterium]